MPKSQLDEIENIIVSIFTKNGDSRTFTLVHKDIMEIPLSDLKVKSKKKDKPAKYNDETLMTKATKLSTLLITAVKSHRNVNFSPSKIMSTKCAIYDMIKIDDISYDRINAALVWYTKHIGDPYVPVIYAGTTLREKFLKLEDSINRHRCNSLSRDINNPIAGFKVSF